MGKAHNIQLSVHQNRLILFDHTGCVQGAPGPKLQALVVNGLTN